MVPRVPLPLWLSRGHLPEPAAHGKTALAGGAAQGKVLFGCSFRQSDEGVQGALLFEGGEGGVGVSMFPPQQFLPKQKAFLEGELAVQRKEMEVAGMEGEVRSFAKI